MRPGGPVAGCKEKTVSMGARALAYALVMAVVPTAAGAACQEDIADLERVVPTLTMPTDLRREVEGLQSQAGALCESGDSPGATSAIEAAWNQILASDEVAGRTLAELATGTCLDGVAVVREQVDDASEVGAMGRDMARQLIEHAVRLCGEDERLLAEEKLSLAMAILTKEQ